MHSASGKPHSVSLSTSASAFCRIMVAALGAKDPHRFYPVPRHGRPFGCKGARGSGVRLLAGADQVFEVPVIFLADVLHQLAFELRGVRRELPGSRVGAGIVDRVFDFEMPRIHALNTL